MKKVSTLTLKPAIREQSRTSYLDLYVNEKRLAAILDAGDLITPLGWLNQENEQHFVRMLEGKASGDLPSLRVPLFICPECADYGCGTIACRISYEDNVAVWSDFAWESSVEIKQLNFEYRYQFDATEYVRIFNR
jgi:hypothetical protein